MGQLLDLPSVGDRYSQLWRPSWYESIRYGADCRIEDRSGVLGLGAEDLLWQIVVEDEQQCNEQGVQQGPCTGVIVCEMWDHAIAEI